jgi:bifunctional non-homologous end joining protein LigD
LPLEQKFPAISQSVARLKLRRTILDGEIIALDENGIPRFQLLQRFHKQPTAPTVYFIFDVLWAGGTDIRTKTLMERRAVLESIIKNSGIQLGSFVECEGKALFDLAKTKGMESIVAKRKNSIYRPGKRSSDWLKIKSRPQQEFVEAAFYRQIAIRKSAQDS